MFKEIVKYDLYVKVSKVTDVDLPRLGDQVTKKIEGVIGGQSWISIFSVVWNLDLRRFEKDYIFFGSQGKVDIDSMVGEIVLAGVLPFVQSKKVW